MQDRANEIVPNIGFKADNFDTEKQKADEMEAQNIRTGSNTSAEQEQEILEQQKERG